MHLVVCLGTTAFDEVVSSTARRAEESALAAGLALARAGHRDLTVVIADGAEDQALLACALGVTRTIAVSWPEATRPDVALKALALAKLIARESFGLVICGVDPHLPASALVPGALSEIRHLSPVNAVDQVELEASLVRAVSSKRWETVELESELPALVTVVPGAYSLRHPTLWEIARIRAASIEWVRATELVGEAGTKANTGDTWIGRDVTPTNPDVVASAAEGPATALHFLAVHGVLRCG